MRPSTVSKPKILPPDVIADANNSRLEPIGFMRNGKVHKLLIQPEDPHRRRYKLLLAANFLLVALINCAVDLAFQVNSVKRSSVGEEEVALVSLASTAAQDNHVENLATAAYAVSHLQQIGDPLIFLAAEFLFKS